MFWLYLVSQNDIKVGRKMVKQLLNEKKFDGVIWPHMTPSGSVPVDRYLSIKYSINWRRLFKRNWMCNQSTFRFQIYTYFLLFYETVKTYNATKCNKLNFQIHRTKNLSLLLIKQTSNFKKSISMNPLYHPSC